MFRVKTRVRFKLRFRVRLRSGFGLDNGVIKVKVMIPLRFKKR